VETIGYDEIVRLLQSAAARIKDNHAHLSQLDSAVGDGDHGSAMVRAMEAVEKAIAESDGGDMKGVLYSAGWGLMSAAGGAPGPLLGSLLMGMSESVAGKDALDCPAMAEMFEKGLANLRKQSKAELGDKTMVDALVPAVEAIRAAADGSQAIPAALAQAAAAAAAGAESTRDMLAKFGKARNLGERTLGIVDPGATSISYIFRAFADAAGE